MNSPLYLISSQIVKKTYSAGRPICHKVLQKMFWEVPPADWLILLLPSAQAGPRNSHGKTEQNLVTDRMPHSVNM